MALKDWIKDDRFTNAWRSKRNFNIINVYSGIEKEEWIVNVSTRFGHGLIERHFNSEQKALSFAKSYMRNN